MGKVKHIIKISNIIKDNSFFKFLVKSLVLKNKKLKVFYNFNKIKNRFFEIQSIDLNSDLFKNKKLYLYSSEVVKLKQIFYNI